jgi:hypothetical protein
MPATPTVLRTPPAYPESALPLPVHKLEHPPALVKAQSLALLMFEKPELARVESFLTDFGMRTVLRTADRLMMRGSGSAPCICVAHRGPRSRYVGAAFTVADDAELALLESKAGARRLPHEAIPGGGRGAELIDPAGNLLWLIAGQVPVDPLPTREPLHPLTNGPGSRAGEQSREGMTETLVPGAAPVGWVAVVRPDRTVLHDGPLEELETVMRESLALLCGAQTREHVARAAMEVSH